MHFGRERKMQLLRAGKALRKNVVLVMLISNRDRKLNGEEKIARRMLRLDFEAKKIVVCTSWGKEKSFNVLLGKLKD